MSTWDDSPPDRVQTSRLASRGPAMSPAGPPRMLAGRVESPAPRRLEWDREDRSVADAVARSEDAQRAKATPKRCAVSAQGRELTDPGEMHGAERM